MSEREINCFHVSKDCHSLEFCNFLRGPVSSEFEDDDYVHSMVLRPTNISLISSAQRIGMETDALHREICDWLRKYFRLKG